MPSLCVSPVLFDQIYLCRNFAPNIYPDWIHHPSDLMNRFELVYDKGSECDVLSLCDIPVLFERVGLHGYLVRPGSNVLVSGDISDNNRLPAEMFVRVWVGELTCMCCDGLQVMDARAYTVVPDCEGGVRSRE